MTTRRPNSYPSNSYERTGLVISVLLHVILLLVIVNSNAPHPPAVTAISVTIEPPLTRSPRQQPQIVSPSDRPSIKPPESTTKLADKDSQTDVERIKRGDGGGLPGPQSQSQGRPQEQKKPSAEQKPAQSQPQAKEPDREPPQRHDQPKQQTSKRDLNVKDLTLDKSTLAMKFGTTPQPAAPAKNSHAAPQNLSEYQAFSRPPGSGAAFLGTAGISDHLPNLPDGDITLLNAKANIYASFVRRVAIQVFTQLRSQGWERLSGQQIRQLSGFTTIEAILSPDGKFIRAQLLESSGSESFDGVVNLSVTSGARDPNPPPGALAKDGMIHFIFKARSWSQMGVNRRSGAPMEQRWLLLATGLE